LQVSNDLCVRRFDSDQGGSKHSIFRWFGGPVPDRIVEKPAKARGSHEPLSAHRITFSQTLPCLMRILAIEKAKSDMIATTTIAPQM
jgi:hypothetical protein